MAFMPGVLLVPAGLGGVAAKLEVILEEMLEVKGLPTGRMPSTSCNESWGRKWDACLQKLWRRLGEARQGERNQDFIGLGAIPGAPC